MSDPERAGTVLGKAIIKGLNGAKNKAQDERGMADKTEVSGQLPMPVEQEISPYRIAWRWDPASPSGNKWSVGAEYNRVSQEYSIETKVWKAGNGFVQLSSEETKAYAEALLSAVQWEHIWQQHVGYFLTGVEKVGPDFEPEPRPESMETNNPFDEDRNRVRDK